MKWTDINGTEHEIIENIELQLQQPRCKYLLPCGLCTLTSSLVTCSLLKDPKSISSEDK